LGLVVVNLLHYYNIGDINYILETYYGGGVHIKYFGLNSLGEPAVKRMVGTMGNPNINGILFAFFTIGFLPLNYDKKMIPWFVSALLMMFLCQSRTIILAIGFTMLLVFVLQLSNWKLKHWSWIALMFSTYFVSWAMATDFFAYSLYSNSMFDAELMETRSAMGRFEVWNYLWQMVKNNPFWGHGPYKEYFYENQIYPENEYILILWRYGFIGLLSYFSLFALPAFWFMKNLKKDNLNKYGILLINLMLITATTNAPFTNRNIRVIFAMALGLIFSEIYKKHLHSENQ
jgi:O-antigen ligase